MMNLAPAEQKVLAQEIGLQVITRLRHVPAPSEQTANFQWPRCLHCRRRPTMTERRGVWLKILTGITSSPDDVITVPRYEILPCCSAEYVKVIEHQTRKEKLRAAHHVDR